MSSEELTSIMEFACQFADDHLCDYIGTVKNSHRHLSRKEVNDPIWGTISLSPVEVVLVDSPLVQRLRNIRQLGVVHWVYPGAVHTRFEHTLGVLFQAQALIQAINRLSTESQTNSPVDRNYEQIIRIAAILHDVGHAVFSHVSEFALNESPFIIAARNEFSSVNKGGLKQISEIFAYYVVKSKAFSELTTMLFSRFDGFVSLTEKRDANIQLFIEKVADAIVGNRISDQVPILHEIISGPFDADKLDYFIRDARNAGTPSVVDISRLVQIMTVKEFSAAELPDDIGRSVSGDQSSYTLFGVKWSGIPVLDELHLARILLFSKVYRHGKVTAIEQMLALAINCLVRVFDVVPTMKVLYSGGDVQFLEYNVSQLCELVGKLETELTIDDSRWLKRFMELCNDLKHRRVHMKAFQVQRNYPDVIAEEAKFLSLRIIEFIEKLDTLSGRAEIKSKIANLMTNALKVSGEEVLDSEDVISRISISVSGPTPGGTQIGRAFIIPDSGKPIKFSKYIVNRTAWANGYMSDQPMAYFFTEERFADLLFVSLELILRTDYGAVLPPSGMAACKRTPERISALKKKLGDFGFYKGVPHDIRAVPERLTRADIAPRLSALETKLSVYEVPQASDSDLPAKVNRDRIFHWLLQFEEDHRIECAIRCLERLKIIRRADTVEAIKQFIMQNREFEGAPVIGFGDAKDSGSMQAYFAGDLPESYISSVSTLQAEASKKPFPTHVIFLDDFIGRGGQSRDILAAGLGVSELRSDLDEQRDLFGALEIEFLKGVKVGFVFTAGWSNGKKELEKATTYLQIDATIHINLTERVLPFFDLEPDDTLEKSEIGDFKSFCETVGRDLILGRQKDPNSDEAKEKVENRHSGYGNRGMLLCSTSNTPTQSVTALWASGLHNDLEWIPLLPRRTKK